VSELFEPAAGERDRETVNDNLPLLKTSSNNIQRYSVIQFSEESFHKTYTENE
jgi:hypothetical protein